LRKKLALLKQTRDLQTYIFQFRNLIGQLIEMADLDQVQYFQAGLKPVTRMEVNYRNPQDLEAAIRIAIEFDASRFGAQRPLMTQTNPTRSFQHNHDDGGVRPMELDNINNRTRLSEAEKAKLIKEGKCFKCRKQGHRASRCPERTNRQTAAAVGTPRAEEGPTLNQVQPTKKTREQLIRVEGMIAGNPATILIDSGASRNYIDQKFTKEHEIPVKPGTASPTIELADGTLSKCAGQTNGLTIEFQAHTTKEQQFDVLPLGQNDAILGKPWLWDTNPTINWRTNEVTVKGTTLRSLSQDFEEAATLNMARKNKRKSKGKSATPAPPVYGRNAVNFLGHTVSDQGLMVDPHNIDATRTWPAPTNLHEFRSFPLATYYRKFVKDFSKPTSPMTDLHVKDRPYNWTPRPQTSFDSVKKALTTTPVIALPNPKKPFVVTTDASDTAIDAVLSQDQERGDQPIAFESRKRTPAERN